MVWIFLEAGLALLLAVLIVWWTLPSKRRRHSHERRSNGDAPGKDGA